MARSCPRVLAMAGALTLFMSDPAEPSWVPDVPFPDDGRGRVHAVGLVRGDSLFAMGGTPFTGGVGTVHVLPPGATAWSLLPGLEGAMLRLGAGIDPFERIVVFGGHDPVDGDVGNTYTYDLVEGPADGLADPGPAAPIDHVAFAVDGARRFYACGGGPGPDATPGDPNRTHVERYDAVLDAWLPIAPMLTAVADAAATGDGNGHLLVIGGFDATASTRLTNVARYDVATDAWSDDAIPDLPVGLTGHRAIRGADDRVYVLGGISGPVDAGDVESRVYALDPGGDAWTEVAPMTHARHHFGVVLAPDDHLHVLGGDDGAGGTHLTEKLYTPPCPGFDREAGDRHFWSEQVLVLDTEVHGGEPLSLRWRKDGEDLVDGTAPGGGVLAGAATEHLTITPCAPADTGVYELVATNPCGTTIATSVVTVEDPTPLPPAWTFTSLHPPGATSSVALDVDATSQSGTITVPVGDGSETHASLWSGTADSHVDLHPPTTTSSTAAAIAGGVQAGTWYHPYEVYHQGQWYTVYFPEACLWTGDAASHVLLHVSGWEYSGVSDTDGIHQVGSISRDDEVGNPFIRAAMWTGTAGSHRSLHPTGVQNSGLIALDGERQYGWIHTPQPGSVTHAAGWMGTADSFTDMHPTGASRSWVTGAGDEQIVGMAEFGGVLAPVLWGVDPGVVRRLDEGSGGGQIVDVSGGLQVGHATIEGTGHAVIWSGTGTSRVDLHAHADPEFESTTARAIHVGPDGSIAIVGSGYNGATGRTEAILWTSESPLAVNDPGTGPDIDPAGPARLVSANPTSRFTPLTLDVRAPSHLRVDLFDVTGRHLATLADGHHAIGRIDLPLPVDQPPGILYVRLDASGWQVLRRLVLLP